MRAFAVHAALFAGGRASRLGTGPDIPRGAIQAAETAMWNFNAKLGPVLLRRDPRIKEFVHTETVLLSVSTIYGVAVSEGPGMVGFSITAVPFLTRFRGAAMTVKVISAPEGFHVSIQNPSRQLLTLIKGDNLSRLEPQIFQIEVTVPKGTDSGVHTVVFDVAGTQTRAYIPVRSTDSRLEYRQVFAINDFHGRLPPQSLGNGLYTGGVAVAEMILAGLNQAGADKGIFVSAGDNIGASLYESSASKDVPTMDMLRVMGLSVTAVGNHEFDSGYNRLVNEVSSTIGCPILGANVFKADDSSALDGYQVFDLSGVKVGFIGVVTQAVPSLVSPDGIEGLHFTNAITAANGKLADNKEKADVWILLVHQGAGDGSATIDAELAKGGEFADIINNASTDFHAIMMGHTHQRYLWVHKGVPIIQTGCYGEAIANFEIPVLIDNNSVQPQTVTARNIDVGLEKWWSDNDDAFVNTSIITTEGAQAVFGIIQDAIKVAEEKGKTVLGKTSGNIERGKDSSGVEDRGVEGPLVQVVADAVLQYLSAPSRQAVESKPVISIINPGGVRDDILYGENGTVTERDVVDVLPFADTLKTSLLTGNQICEILNEQWQPEGSSRPFLHLGVAGIRFSYDWENKKIELGDIIGPYGQALDHAAVYRVGTNNFLQAGGDNFFTFTNATDVADTGFIDSDSLSEYFRLADEVFPPFIERAINKTLDMRSLTDFWIAKQEGDLTPGAYLRFWVQLKSQVDLAGPFCLLLITRNDTSPTNPNDQHWGATVLAVQEADLSAGSQLELDTGVFVTDQDAEWAELRVFAATTVYDGNPLPGGLGIQFLGDSLGDNGQNSGDAAVTDGIIVPVA